MNYLAMTCLVENLFFVLLIEIERWYLNRFREIGALVFAAVCDGTLLLSESEKKKKTKC